jgi:hypothetical protein
MHDTPGEDTAMHINMPHDDPRATADPFSWKPSCLRWCGVRQQAGSSDIADLEILQRLDVGCAKQVVHAKIKVCGPIICAGHFLPLFAVM